MEKSNQFASTTVHQFASSLNYACEKLEIVFSKRQDKTYLLLKAIENGKKYEVEYCISAIGKESKMADLGGFLEVFLKEAYDNSGHYHNGKCIDAGKWKKLN